MVEKYIRLYMMRNMLLCLGLAVLCWVPLFIVSVIADVLAYDIAFSFVPFPIAGLCVLVSYIPTFRFKKMIKEQETYYHTEFTDSGVKRLENTLFLSDDWLIAAGERALYKEHIRGIRVKSVYSRYGGSHLVKITTVDDKLHSVWVLSSSNIKKIQKWRPVNASIYEEV